MHNYTIYWTTVSNFLINPSWDVQHLDPTLWFFIYFTWTEVIAICEAVDVFLMAEDDILTSLEAFIDMEEAAFISEVDDASNLDPESGF